MRRNLLLIICCIFLQMEMNGQTFTYTPASGSFIVPAAAGLNVKVRAWGGGGAGGGSTNAGLGLARGGAGGGGGAYAESTFTVSLGASLSITVAGSANGNSGADGTNGFDSVVTGFSSDVKAFGGKGGKGNTAGGSPVGGAGGTYFGTAGSNGNPGSSGATGLLISSGAGGSGAGIGGGAGGAAIASNVLANSSGNAGASIGGGGGGAVTSIFGGNYLGGAGAAGKVVIEYTCPNYNSLTSPIMGTSACALIGTSTITLTSSTGLPVGIYTVTYNTSSPSQTGLTTTMTVSAAGTGTFTATGLTTAGNSNITVTKLESGPCFTTIDTNNVATVVVNAATVITMQPTAPAATCSGAGTQTISVTATGAGLTYSWRKDGVAVSNNAVIGGQGTATLTLINPIEADGGSYDVLVSGTCGPAKTSNAVTVTVITPLSNLGGISVNGSTPDAVNTYCASTSAVFSVAAASNASSYTWTVPTGWAIGSGQGTSAVTVITGTSAQSGNVSVYATNLCGDSAPSSQWIDLSIISPIAPTIVLARPDCANPTSEITVTKPVPATGIVYTVTGTNPVVAPISNTSGIFTGLSIGDYAVTYQNGSGCVSAAQTVSVEAANTNIWDGVKWSKTLDTTPPTSGDIVVFNGNYSENADVQGCSCQVNAGFTVTIPGRKTMIITNTVSASGTLIFEDGASLVQVNDGSVNSGIITYKRNSAPMKDFDFTRWSSPVLGQNLKLLSPNTLRDKYYSFEQGNWFTILDGNDEMDPGKGYSIRAPRPQFWPDPTAATYVHLAQFVGVPNNGVITIPSQAPTKYNLIGNPYPSAIDADEFITQNSALIDGTLYFWTHNTAIKPSGSFYVYSSNDYATYTLTGGVGTGVGNFVDVNNNGIVDPGEIDGSNEPNGKIAAGQGFFVVTTATGTGNFVFNNSMRNTSKVLASGSNSQFFRMAQTKKKDAIKKSRVWLNLTNSEGAFKQLLVGYITGATNEIDNLYDGETINGNTYVDFYSVNKEKKLAVQGRALPFDKTDKVPLGYSTTIQGTFQISVSKVDGVLANQTVFVEDNVTKAVHNLNNGSYSFTTDKGTFNDRFVLVYVDKKAVVAPPVLVDHPVSSRNPTVEKPTDSKNNKGVIVSVKNRLIKINSFDQNIESVQVYDLRGIQLYKTGSVISNEFVIYSLSSSEQILIIKIQLTNGNWVTKEIFFKN